MFFPLGKVGSMRRGLFYFVSLVPCCISEGSDRQPFFSRGPRYTQVTSQCGHKVASAGGFLSHCPLIPSLKSSWDSEPGLRIAHGRPGQLPWGPRSPLNVKWNLCPPRFGLLNLTQAAVPRPNQNSLESLPGWSPESNL